jgi:hypothetical protein
MSSSWDLGRDNFYATVTNTSNLNIFPSNHPAEFQVQLNQNIILDPEEWEVSLANIHYVHDFPNIGDSTFLKFRHRGEVYTLELPQWYCRKLEDMASFLTSMINTFIETLYEEKEKKIEENKKTSVIPASKKTSTSTRPNQSEQSSSIYSSELYIPDQWGFLALDPYLFHGSTLVQKKPTVSREDEEIVIKHKHDVAGLKKVRDDSKFDWKKSPPKIEIKMDSLQRVNISFDDPDFDISFSSDLLHMLGLVSEPDFTINAFDARTIFLGIISDECETDLFNNNASFYETFGDFKQHRDFRKNFNPEEGMLGFSSIIALNRTIAKILSINSPSNLLNRFLFNFPKEYTIFEEYGSSLTPIAKMWPANSESEKFIDPQEYRKFIFNCEELAEDMEDKDKTVNRYKMGVGFSNVHATLFAAFIVKKILFGSLSDSKFVSKIPGRLNPFELMYVYTDLIKPDPFNEMMSRILMSFQTFGNTGQMVTFTPNPRQYKPLDKSNIGNLKILIASDRGERVPFQRGPSVLTLHFQRRRYFRS